MRTKIAAAVICLLLLAGAGSALILSSEATSTTAAAVSNDMTVRGTETVEISGVNYTLHSPIIINGNENFTYENGVVGGSGIDTDPYIIEDWSIKGFLSGIEIRNTNADFIIRDCYLNDSLLCELGSAGIHLVNVTNGIITNNILHENMHGIWLVGCSHISVKGNSVVNTLDLFMPCFLMDCKKITFINNTFSGKGAGIYLHISDEVIIEHNYFSENEAAFRLWRSSFNLIVFNDIINCSTFSIKESGNNTIYSNNFINLNESRLVEEDLPGTDNCWYDGYFRGNYWSGYSGLDDGRNGRKAGDGVGDTGIPYLGVDNYPLMEPYAGEMEDDKIIITLFLDKLVFYEGEPISGTLTIYNNNPFDIELIEARESWEAGYGVYFEIRSRSMLITYAALTDDIKVPINVKGYEQISIEFVIEDIYVMPGLTNETNLKPGSYLIYSYLYYGNESEHLIIFSNNAYLEIIDQNPVIKNITATLKLDKQEFFVNDPIVGTITIKNNNYFDIVLTDWIFERLLGHHFMIHSIDNDTGYFGLNHVDLYPIEVKSNEMETIKFKIDKYTNVRNGYLYGCDLSTGNYSIYAWFYYGNVSEEEFFPFYPEYIYSNAVEFTVIDRGPEQQGPDGPSDNIIPSRSGFSKEFMLGTVVALAFCVILISTVFITATEVGKYGFYSALAPLYSKQRRKKDENYGYLRGLVLGYIDGNPGESYNSIKRALELNNGALAYHLRVLEREDKIHSERDGTLKRFYPKDGRITREVIELSDIQRDIYEMIRTNPGLSQIDIQKGIDISQQRLNYQIRQMSEARLIRVERDGKKTRCFVIDEE